MAYKNIKDPGRKNRMGGTKQFILVAPFADFTLIQEPTAGSFNITTAHTFPVGKGFIKLYVTKDTGTIKYSTQGGPDRRSYVLEGEFYHPGEEDDIVEFANLAKNDRFITLQPVPGSAEFFQGGGNEFQVEITAEYDATKNSGDGRGWTFKLHCYQSDVVKYKAGTVTMLPDA